MQVRTCTEKCEGQRWQVQFYIYCESLTFFSGLQMTHFASLDVPCYGLTASYIFQESA